MQQQQDDEQNNNNEAQSRANRILMFIWFLAIMTMPALIFSLVMSYIRSTSIATCPGNPRYGDFAFTTIDLVNTTVRKIRLEGSGAVYIRANKTNKVHVELIRQANNLYLLSHRAIWDMQETNDSVLIRHFPYGNAYYNTTECMVVSRVITVPISLLMQQGIDLYVHVSGSKHVHLDESIDVHGNNVQFHQLHLLNENGPITIQGIEAKVLIARTEDNAKSHITIAQSRAQVAKLDSNDFVHAQDCNFTMGYVTSTSGTMLHALCHVQSLETFSNHSFTYFNYTKAPCAFAGKIHLHSDLGFVHLSATNFTSSSNTTSSDWQGIVGNELQDDVTVIAKSYSGSIAFDAP